MTKVFDLFKSDCASELVGKCVLFVTDHKNVFITKSDVFEASYEDAREKFEAMIEPDTEVLM